ncbi:MAG: hypothetical protein ACRDHZ_21770, partial [Ktedonobacteraceae bacterium]
MMEHYYGMTLGEARDLEIPSVFEDVSQLMYGQPFQIPAQFAFTGRAIGTLVGVATGLAPTFNFVDVATPYARTFLNLDAHGISEILRNLPSQALDMGRLLLKLPNAVEHLITRLETGQIEVRLAGETRTNGRGRRGRRRQTQEQSASMGSFAGVLLTAVTMSGGIFLLNNAHLMLPGWCFLGLAGLSTLRLVLKR